LAALCFGEGETSGYYDYDLELCACDNTESDTDYYCDSDCRDYALKAYYTEDGEILLV